MPILDLPGDVRVVNVMNYAGMTTSIALCAGYGRFALPLLSPVIGWIGVFVTGSVTNANVLFAACSPPPRPDWC